MRLAALNVCNRVEQLFNLKPISIAQRKKYANEIIQKSVKTYY